MLCESGERSLDYYFDSVQNSVLRVKSFVEEDLEGLSDDQLEKHMEKAREYFGMMASKTKGVLTYYYRIDPSVSAVKGFWYTDLTGEGFVEHEATDITLYDPEDTSKLVWFTVPKHEGRLIWLPPYVTDNLDVRVISCDAPVYWNGRFIGVVGIEVDYSTMASEVDSIRFYDNGYAFLSDADGKIFYHPRIDVTDPASDVTLDIPFHTAEDNTLVHYIYGGEEKEAVWRTLSNGMRLNVTVPVSETMGEWQGLVLNISMGAVVVLVASSLFFMFYTRCITKPLDQLTQAAEQVEKENYDLKLSYDKDDELGRLTRAFKKLADNVNAHITDLNGQVFIDALTDLKNKGAFSNAVDELQEQINSGKKDLKFAIGVFDCDTLKIINDQYGHDKGDIYLKTAAETIAGVFRNCPVYRIGGDEFAVILRDEDCSEIGSLVERFDKTADEINASAGESWEQVLISKGFAVFDPAGDHKVYEVIQRADKLMYGNKWDRKAAAVKNNSLKNEK
jgi:diguanylate cyclase (GGDEF)-like protein